MYNSIIDWIQRKLNFESNIAVDTKIQKRTFLTNVKANKRIGPHNQDIISIIIGLLLGNGISDRLVEGTRILIRVNLKNKEYIYHLYTLFKDYCGSIPTNMKSFDSRPKKNKIYYSIKFNTYSLPCFNKFRKLFYNTKGIKILPEEIESILTPRSLAYWIMDDGYNNISGFYLCTESFTLSENLKLKKILKINLI